MSFGRPGALTDTFKVSPPQRGSFPLDHDGECKTFMLSYMRCLKTSSADRDSGKCRSHAKAYLECRMDNGLMQRDDFENLGLGDVDSANPTGAKAKAGFVPGAPGGSGMAGVGTGGGAAGTGAAAGAGKAEQERI